MTLNVVSHVVKLSRQQLEVRSQQSFIHLRFIRFPCVTEKRNAF